MSNMLNDTDGTKLEFLLEILVTAARDKESKEHDINFAKLEVLNHVDNLLAKEYDYAFNTGRFASSR